MQEKRREVQTELAEVRKRLKVRAFDESMSKIAIFPIHRIKYNWSINKYFYVVHNASFSQYLY